MRFVYTGSIKEILEEPCKMPFPEDEKMLKYLESMHEKNVCNLKKISITKEFSSEPGYKVFFKSPMIAEDEVFYGLKDVFYSPCVEITPSGDFQEEGVHGGVLYYKNLVKPKVRSKLEQIKPMRKAFELFIFQLLSFIHTREDVINKLSTNYNIYDYYSEDIDFISSKMSEIEESDNLKQNLRNKWLFFLQKNKRNELFEKTLTLEDVIELYAIGLRAKTIKEKGLFLELFYNTHIPSSDMIGADVLIDFVGGSNFIVSKIVLNKRGTEVSNFSESEFFFPLFERNEVSFEKEKLGSVIKRNLGSFFFNELCEDNGVISSVAVEEFFLAHCNKYLNFKNIEILSLKDSLKNTSRGFHDYYNETKPFYKEMIKKNHCLSFKEKAILSALMFLTEQETLENLDRIDLKIENINSDQLELLLMQCKNNEGSNLEKMFNASFSLMKKALSKEIDDLEKIDFDYTKW